MKNLNKIPKKVLLYFIRKNPNFENIKNKSQEELVNIIIENDIICEWNGETYKNCPEVYLKKLCKEKKEENDSNNKPTPRGFLKNKETMIDFLLNKETPEVDFNTILPKIKHCFESLENLDVSVDEIRAMM